MNKMAEIHKRKNLNLKKT